jgi:hypothetical protein
MNRNIRSLREDVWLRSVIFLTRRGRSAERQMAHRKVEREVSLLCDDSPSCGSIGSSSSYSSVFAVRAIEAWCQLRVIEKAIDLSTNKSGRQRKIFGRQCETLMVVGHSLLFCCRDTS